MDERTEFSNQLASYDTINETGADSKTISKEKKFDGREEIDGGGIKRDIFGCVKQVTSAFVRSAETAIHCGVQSSNVEGSKNNKAVDIAVYKRRWYILFLFCLVCFITGSVWNTWGPIAISVEPAVGWKNANIAVGWICGSLSASVSSPMCAWVMDVKGESGGTFFCTRHIDRSFFSDVCY